MKTKEQQIEELKATAVKLQQQIEALEKPKQWEPRGGGYWISCKGIVDNASPVINAARFGTERLTQEAAEKSSAAMRTHNRLLAYVDEFGGDWEADWEDGKQAKYSVRYSHTSKMWSLTLFMTVHTMGTVHMSNDCAEGLVAKLNSGEVVL